MTALREIMNESPGDRLRRSRDWPDWLESNMTERTCTVADCGKPLVARGYCRKHYARLMRRGTVADFEVRWTVPLLDRFWSKVEKSAGCWTWTGQLDSHGYGIFNLRDGTHPKSHRYSWMIDHGPIPAETPYVLHRCDTPACVRPSHLFLGTQADNMRDMSAKGRSCRGRRTNTHCPNGHPYDAENTTIRPDGTRACRECMRAAWTRSNIKRRVTK